MNKEEQYDKRNRYKPRRFNGSGEAGFSLASAMPPPTDTYTNAHVPRPHPTQAPTYPLVNAT